MAAKKKQAKKTQKVPKDYTKSLKEAYAMPTSKKMPPSDKMKLGKGGIKRVKG